MFEEHFFAIAAILVYLVATLFIGMYGYRRSGATPDDFFLAGRGIGPLVLFFTLIATNFSAFYFLGFAGAGYRIGYSYYGIMGFGTGLVALTFYMIGRPVWRFGKLRGYITPPELIGDRLNSVPLKLLYLAVMVAFTVPYLALQPIGAGYLVNELTGGNVPYFFGASALTGFIVLYVFLGGMRSVALTDVLQGVLMFTLMLAATLFIGAKLGGIEVANARAFAERPDLFSRTGGGDYFTPAKWFSFMALWMLSVPMFPQIFMRFFAAQSSQSLQKLSVLYPIVAALLFFCPIMIGVWGAVEFPGLEGKASDQILPMMLDKFAPEWMAAFIMVGAVAAIMSTLDSQLLALSSIMTRDVYLGFINRSASLARQTFIGKMLVIILAVAGLIIAYNPPASIFQIATVAFSGLAILFPTTIAAIYWPQSSAWACFTSIFVGEALLIGFTAELIPASLTFGFIPILPIIVLCTMIIVAGSLGKMWLLREE